MPFDSLIDRCYWLYTIKLVLVLCISTANRLHEYFSERRIKRCAYKISPYRRCEVSTPGTPNLVMKIPVLTDRNTGQLFRITIFCFKDFSTVLVNREVDVLKRAQTPRAPDSKFRECNSLLLRLRHLQIYRGSRVARH